MTNSANGSPSEEPTSEQPASVPATADTVERYQTDDGTVIYDAERPMAWIFTDDAVALREMR